MVYFSRTFYALHILLFSVLFISLNPLIKFVIIKQVFRLSYTRVFRVFFEKMSNQILQGHDDIKLKVDIFVTRPALIF